MMTIHDTNLKGRTALREYIIRAVTGGIVGTIPMSILMYYGPAVGMAKWPVPDVLSDMTGAPIAVGWLLHFAIGVIFAFVYLFTWDRVVPVRSDILRGALFGIPAYGVAFSSWLVMERLGWIHFSSYFPISYSYLIEHIVFAAGMGIYVPYWNLTQSSVKERPNA